MYVKHGEVKGMWVCSKCEQENSGNFSKCILCGTEKPQLPVSHACTTQQASPPIQPGFVEAQPIRQENQYDVTAQEKQANTGNSLLKWDSPQDPKKPYIYESKTEVRSGESLGFWVLFGLGACVFLIVLNLFVRGIISYVSP